MRFTAPLFLVLAVFLAGCQSQDVPPIDQPTQLVADCAALLNADSSVLIDRASWPDSVRRLNPVTVEKGPGYIMITTYAETGVGARGYLVAKDQPVIARYEVTSTSQPGIWQFTYQP